MKKTVKTKKRGPKRRIRKSIVAIAVLSILVVIGLCYMPGMITSIRLSRLGYDRTAIRNIREQGLEKDLLSHQYCSDYLIQAINDGTLQKEYMYLYTVLDPSRTLEKKDFLLYNRLVDKGYETDQMVNLYQKLTFRELTPLLVFDYQWDENGYIDDCISHREDNASGNFTLEGEYITYYRMSETIEEPDETSLVNQSLLLPSDYVPQNLTSLSSEHAVDGVQMCQDTADAFTQLSMDSIIADHSLYASAGYTDYASQESAYTYFVNHTGAASADYYTERAGSSEHQTGTAVNVSLTYENNNDFVNTGAYAWLSENADKYGFILRYPQKFAYITGRSEANHIRYLGKDLAKKVNASGLSYDEYYLLYLADWNDTSLIPGSDILSATDYAGSH
ncbi:MAG: M15 family metallopeptidase [Bulleidia sp.]